MEEKKLVPKLRFPGFTEPWEQRKLGEEAIEILAGGDIEKEKVVYDSGYPIYANALTNDGLVGYYTDYYRVEAPAVTVTGRGEVGHAQARSQNFTPIVRLLAIRSKHDCYFLENAINNYKTIVESTGVPQLTVPQLSAYKLCFPLNIEEEKRISICFQNLDTLITLHQRKLEHLKLKKKSLLQKLFPKEGEVYPELRFPGFTAPWEQRKLGDLADGVFGGGTPKTSIDTYWNGSIPWIQSSNLMDDKIENFINDKSITNLAIKESATKLIPANSIAIVTRVGVGKVALIREKFATSQDFLSFYCRHEHNPLFIAYQISRLMKVKSRLLQGTSIKGITKSEVLESEVLIPKGAEEEIKIADFLSSCDTLITLHQRKLEHLQLLKKALLQQLFV